MEEKDLYTQTEVAQALGKTLSNLAFYKEELKEKGYMVQSGNKEVITKEGFNYLKIRFSESYRKPKTNTKQEENITIGQKILEDQLKTAQEEKEYYKKQMEKWQLQCTLWQKQLDEKEQDKNFWKEFAMERDNLIKEKLLPEKTTKLPFFKKKRRNK